jgi:hypothetical protein
MKTISITLTLQVHDIANIEDVINDIHINYFNDIEDVINIVGEEVSNEKDE